MSDETKAVGLQVPCPCCNEPSANVSLHLWDGSFHCEECGTDFTREEIEHLMRRWEVVLRWLDTIPGGES